MVYTSRHNENPFSFEKGFSLFALLYRKAM